jgi:ADP-ribose pyrophosphatase
MISRIKRVKETQVYSNKNNPFIKIYCDEVQFPNGIMGYYSRIVESEGKHGVAVLPLRYPLIGLVRQYRYPIDEEVWEIPRGFGESIDPRQDAVRELREETGYTVNPDSLISLGSIHPNSGLLASSVYLFIAHCFESPDNSIDENEIIQFKWFDINQVLDLVRDNEIKDSFTMCAILLANQKKIINYT